MKNGWLGGLLRRLGRVGIGLAAFIAGGIVFVLMSLVNLRGVGWWWRICAIAAFGTALGVYKLFDRLDLIPGDPDPPTTLSLRDYSTTKTRPPKIRDRPDSSS